MNIFPKNTKTLNSKIFFCYLQKSVRTNFQENYQHCTEVNYEQGEFKKIGYFATQNDIRFANIICNLLLDQNHSSFHTNGPYIFILCYGMCVKTINKQSARPYQSSSDKLNLILY